MADKHNPQVPEAAPRSVAPGFYVFLGVMGLSFLLIVGYMISLYLS